MNTKKSIYKTVLFIAFTLFTSQFVVSQQEVRVDGNFRADTLHIGSDNLEGQIKYDNADFWGHDGAQWKSFTNSNSFDSLFYFDGDMDGYGDPQNIILANTRPTGYVTNNDDCDDLRPSFNPSQVDFPDAQFIDNNCDGIDGDTANVVYVSPLGDDNNSGLSPSSPVKTIDVAINIGVLNGRSHVIADQGTYPQMVNLEEGISLFGGYDASLDWIRGNYVSKIESNDILFDNIVGIKGDNINLPTQISGFNIHTADSDGVNSISSYGIHCLNCDSLVISHNYFFIGDGSDGMNGIAGNSGAKW